MKRFTPHVIAGLLILVAAAARLVPHAPNFTPLGAIALFGGARMRGPLKVIIPIGALFISDLFLGFHGTMPFVYGSFLLIIALGRYIEKNTDTSQIAAASVGASSIFFLVTNFGVWLITDMYAKTIHGLTQAYVMGLPFFKYTLAGDLIFSVILFYGYRLLVSIQYPYHQIQEKKIESS